MIVFKSSDGRRKMKLFLYGVLLFDSVPTLVMPVLVRARPGGLSDGSVMSAVLREGFSHSVWVTRVARGPEREMGGELHDG